MTIEFTNYFQSFDELRDSNAAALEVEELEVEEIEITSFSVDPRLSHLSNECRDAIEAFEYDVDIAAYEASKRMQYKNPPAWAIELDAAQRSGWKNMGVQA